MRSILVVVLAWTSAALFARDTKLHIRASYEIGWLNYVFLKQNGWSLSHRRWQTKPFWDTDRLPLLVFPAHDAKKRVKELFTAFPLLQWRRGTAPRLSDQILKQLRWGADEFAESYVNHCPRYPTQQEQCLFTDSIPPLRLTDRRGQRMHTTAQQELAIHKLKNFAVFVLPLESKAMAETLTANDIRLVESVMQLHANDWQKEWVKSARLATIRMKGRAHNLIGAHNETPETNKLETVLQLAHAPIMLTAFLKRKPTLAPLAGVIAAAAFALRSRRTWRELRRKRVNFELPDEAEEHTLFYNALLNTAGAPVALWGGGVVGKLIGKVKRASWRAWRHLSWRDKMANLDFVSSFSLSRAIDAKAHLQRKENPLKSKNFVINTGYNTLGAFLNRQALVSSGSWRGRIMSMMAISIAYSYGNVYVQEIQGLFGDDFSGRNIQWDNQWGAFHSSPRNLIDWSLWNMLVRAKAHPAIVTTIKGADGIQRKIWYSNSKLSYLRDELSYWEAMWDVQKGDYLP